VQLRERASGGPESGLSVSKGGCKKEGNRLFRRDCCDRTRGNGFKLKEGRFRLDIRKMSFIVRVVRHWHRLTKEANENCHITITTLCI